MPISNHIQQSSHFDEIDDPPSFHSVYDLASLRASFTQVKKNKGASGTDGQTISSFEQNLEEHLLSLASDLSDGSYTPSPIRRVLINKPGSSEKRPLGISTVRDRVVQTALRSVIEPVFEKSFSDRSYGFRPRLGCLDALKRVKELLKAGYAHVLDADLKSYFDTIPHNRLLERVAQKIDDDQLLMLVKAFLEQQVLSDLGMIDPIIGTPQGAVISPLLSNIYLDPLDHLMTKQNREMVRYADDFLILCRSQRSAEKARAQVESWAERNGLIIHPEKTKIVNETEKGFDFLGHHFESGKISPRQKSVKKLKDSVCSMIHASKPKTTQIVIKKLNTTLQGWSEFFQLCPPSAFGELDRWIRMQMRIHRNRLEPGAHSDTRANEWTNEYLNKIGLFSLKNAATQRLHLV